MTDYLNIDTPDGTAEAYVARPTEGAAGDAPGVLFFVDAIGLRPQTEQMADRIASWGYVVLAPNTMYRSGTAAELAPSRDLREPGAREEFFAELSKQGRLTALDAAATERDIPVYLAALRGLDGVSAGPVGVVGYCMGARFAVRAAGVDEQVAAAAGFHGGGLVTDEPDSPHTRLATAKAAFCFGHADNDRSMTPDAVEALGRALAEHGLSATNVVYPDAAHGYTMADTSMYQEAGAERAFVEMWELVDRALR